jgi:hypothetical protein
MAHIEHLYSTVVCPHCEFRIATRILELELEEPVIRMFRCPRCDRSLAQCVWSCLHTNLTSLREFYHV